MQNIEILYSTFKRPVHERGRRRRKNEENKWTNNLVPRAFWVFFKMAERPAILENTQKALGTWLVDEDTDRRKWKNYTLSHILSGFFISFLLATALGVTHFIYVFTRISICTALIWGRCLFKSRIPQKQNFLIVQFHSLHTRTKKREDFEERTERKSIKIYSLNWKYHFWWK